MQWNPRPVKARSTRDVCSAGKTSVAFSLGHARKRKQSQPVMHEITMDYRGNEMLEAEIGPEFGWITALVAKLQISI
jgi:hypothetical protein